jgi:hypothetical protein
MNVSDAFRAVRGLLPPILGGRAAPDPGPAPLAYAEGLLHASGGDVLDRLQSPQAGPGELHQAAESVQAEWQRLSDQEVDAEGMQRLPEPDAATGDWPHAVVVGLEQTFARAHAETLLLLIEQVLAERGFTQDPVDRLDVSGLAAQLDELRAGRDLAQAYAGYLQGTGGAHTAHALDEVLHAQEAAQVRDALAQAAETLAGAAGISDDARRMVMQHQQFGILGMAVSLNEAYGQSGSTTPPRLDAMAERIRTHVPRLAAFDEIATACSALRERWMANLSGEPIYAADEALIIESAWTGVHEATGALRRYGFALDNIDRPASGDPTAARDAQAAAEDWMAALERDLAGLQPLLQRAHDAFQNPDTCPPALLEIRSTVEPVIALLRGEAVAEEAAAPGPVERFAHGCETLSLLLPGTDEARRSAAVQAQLNRAASMVTGPAG